MSLPWATCCPDRRRQVQCGCRRVSPSCAADCPERCRGLFLLLLVMGRWSVMLCRTLRRIPLFRQLTPSCCNVVSLIGGHQYTWGVLHRGHQYMWSVLCWKSPIIWVFPQDVLQCTGCQHHLYMRDAFSTCARCASHTLYKLIPNCVYKHMV